MNILKTLIRITILLAFISCNTNKRGPDINSEKKLIFNATIITMNQNLDILENAYMLIRNNIISEIGVGEVPDVDGYKIDAKDKILIPGFINTHTHLPMTIFRGLSDDKALDDWLNNYIWPAEKKFLNEKTIALGTQLGLIEMIRSGTVCFNDNYFFAETIARETEKSGMRAVISETILDFPTNSYRNTEEAFKISKEFIAKWKTHNYIHPAICCHSIYTVSRENLVKVKNLASEYLVPINIHISETFSEVENCIKTNGKSPVEYLYDLEFFKEKILAAHCVWFDEEDMEIFLKNNVSVLHNPTSNLKLASGIAPVPDYLNKGINVALGTDGAASNNNLDMLEEARLAALLHKGNSMDPEVLDAQTALKMLTINGAKALGLENITGSLEIGKRADLILIDKNSAENVPSYDYYSTIIYSTNSSSVNTVIVEGKILMIDRELITIDERDVIIRVKELREKIAKGI